jgi:hypothetical protein
MCSVPGKHLYVSRFIEMFKPVAAHNYSFESPSE